MEIIDIKKSTGSKIYVEPYYFKHNFTDYIEPLSLLIDKIFIYNPTDWLSNKTYSKDKFIELVEEKIFLPIYLEDNVDKEMPYYLTRDKILNDQDFFPIYKEYLEDDLEKKNIKNIIKKYLPHFRKKDLEDLYFSVNWDLIIMQSIDAFF